MQVVANTNTKSKSGTNTKGFRPLTPEDIEKLIFQRFTSDQPLGVMLNKPGLQGLGKPTVHVGKWEKFPDHISIQWNLVGESRMHYGQNPLVDIKGKIRFEISLEAGGVTVVTLTPIARLH